MTDVPMVPDQHGLSPIEYEDPMAVVARQSRMAKALADVIEQQGEIPNPFVSRIGNKDYLTFESWQLIARFNLAHVELDEDRGVEPVEENGQTVAYQATVNVIDNRTGMRLSRATMECGMNSFPTQGKVGREKVKAAQSAAQTWAASKACRMAFSGIAVLAGYQPATAEEMAAPSSSGSKGADAPEEGDSGVECPQHPGQTFFRTGKMKGYAHKDEDGGWCNFRPAMFSQAVEAACLAAKVERGNEHSQIGGLTKAWFGRSWSQLNPMQVLDLISKLYELADQEQTYTAEDEATADPEPTEAHSEPTEAMQGTLGGG